MTCREFENRVHSLVPRGIARMEDPAVVQHAGECADCRAWLQDQRMLSGALLSLNLRTADREAGPEVELALLRAFRQPATKRACPAGELGFIPATQWRGRRFEWGAYVAVAATLVLALFLAYRAAYHAGVVADGSHGAVQAARKSIVPQDKGQVNNIGAGNASPQAAGVSANPLATAKVEDARRAMGLLSSPPASPEETLAKAGYVDLMLCDPLSCAAEAQVVRMEIPGQGAGGQTGQPVIADVVVGDDGLVRAVRIVN